MSWDIVLRVYRASLRILPQDVRRDDGPAMVEVLRDELADSPGAWERAGAVARAFRGLPSAAIGMRMDARRERASLGTGRTRGGERMKGGFGAVRFAARTLWKSPAFTWATVLLLALGIGAGTAAFSIVDHVMIRPLPYPQADRLVYMTNGAHSGPTLRRLDSVDGFDLWTAARGSTVNLARTEGEPLRLSAAEVTPDFFQIFGVRPALGRLLIESDEGPWAVGVLTHEAWERIWGGDPTIVGSTVQLDGRSIEVVGVLDPAFVEPHLTARSLDVIFPMDWTNPDLEEPGHHAHSVVARLAPDVSISQADEELDRVAAEVMAAYPDHYAEYSEPADWPLTPLAEQTVGQEVAQGLGLLLGAVVLLLLVACSNVAHLFLARGIGRTREMSLRRALGASTRSLVGLLLAEGVVIGAAATLLGLGLAWLALQGFGRWTSGLPRGDSIVLDPRVILFAIGLSLITVLVFGLVPALRSARRDLHDTLRGGGRGASSSRSVKALRSALVVGEVAFSLLLVAMAGLFMRSFVEISNQETGMVADNVYMVPISIPPPETGEAYVETMTTIAEAVRTVPGVVSATWSAELPFENTGGNSCCWATSFAFEEGGETVRLAGHSVDEAFFETFGTELVAGEVFRPGGTEPVVIIGERTAIRGWGSAEEALGETVHLRGRERRIIGVAEATLHYGLDQSHDIAAYLPAWHDPFPIPWGSVAVKSRPGVQGIDRSLREAIWSVAPNLPIPTVQTLDGLIAESTSGRRLGGVLSTSFGIVALLLAAGGLYGTLLYAVGEQRRAIGIRMALGAGKSRIQSSIVGRAIALSLGGVALGLTAAWFGTRFLEAFLFGIQPRDPLSFAAAAVLLLVVAALAAWLPARTASRTDPMETLRTE